jgi:succinate dehydrogenase assembly factor 2
MHTSLFRRAEGDPYPLPLSPELDQQRAQPHGSIQSSESSALNTETEEDWPMPQPLDRTGEKTETMRARLVYQARKRGMLEGDLLLSTFARDNLAAMSHDELLQFDKVCGNVPHLSGSQ